MSKKNKLTEKKLQTGITFNEESGITARDMFNFVHDNENLPKPFKAAFTLSRDDKTLLFKDPKLSGEWGAIGESLNKAFNTGNWEVVTATSNFPIKPTDDNDKGKEVFSRLQIHTIVTDKPGHRGTMNDIDSNGKVLPPRWFATPTDGSREGIALGETFPAEVQQKKHPSLSDNLMRSDPPDGSREQGKRGIIAITDTIIDETGYLAKLKDSKKGQNEIVYTFIHEAALHAGKLEQNQIWEHFDTAKIKEGTLPEEGHNLIMSQDTFLRKELKTPEGIDRIKEITREIKKNGLEQEKEVPKENLDHTKDTTPSKLGNPKKSEFLPKPEQGPVNKLDLEKQTKSEISSFEETYTGKKKREKSEANELASFEKQAGGQNWPDERMRENYDNVQQQVSPDQLNKNQANQVNQQNDQGV